MMTMKGSTCKAPTIYFSGPRDLENAVNWPIISILSATELSLETNHRTSIGDRILTRLPFPAIGLAVLGDRNLNAYIYCDSSNVLETCDQLSENFSYRNLNLILVTALVTRTRITLPIFIRLT